jgi:hypothetical protein
MYARLHPPASFAGGGRARARVDPHPVLRLQRTVGNRAVCALLQRRHEFRGDATYQLFKVGREIDTQLAQTAWALTVDGTLDPSDVETLRKVAESSGETIDDNERMFMAALLDPQNVKRLHEQNPGGFVFGEAAFPQGSITAANRASIRDSGRAQAVAPAADVERLLTGKTVGPFQAAARKGQLQKLIVDTAGPFAPTARGTLALADNSGIDYATVYRAMIAGASDSTPGDRAFAGATYVIARRAGLDAEAKNILAGQIKVDEIDPAKLPDAIAQYMPIAQEASDSFKGDTVYLKSTFDVTDVYMQGAVVHELTHADDDSQYWGTAEVSAADAELKAFLNQARYLLRELDKRSGADRAAAVKQVQAIAQPAELLSLYYMARVAKPVAARPRYEQIADDIQAGALVPLGAQDVLGAKGGWTDDWLWGEARSAVKKRSKKTDESVYVLNGLVGESLLDEP